jgi:hypothetical protein
MSVQRGLGPRSRARWWMPAAPPAPRWVRAPEIRSRATLVMAEWSRALDVARIGPDMSPRSPGDGPCAARARFVDVLARACDRRVRVGSHCARVSTDAALRRVRDEASAAATRAHRWGGPDRRLPMPSEPCRVRDRRGRPRCDRAPATARSPGRSRSGAAYGGRAPHERRWFAATARGWQSAFSGPWWSRGVDPGSVAEDRACPDAAPRPGLEPWRKIRISRRDTPQWTGPAWCALSPLSAGRSRDRADAVQRLGVWPHFFGRRAGR